MRKLRTLDDLHVDGKRVIVRTDFNVSVGNDGIVDFSEDYRLESALPTIQELSMRRCKVLLLSHRGRPEEGGEAKDFDMTPVRHRLEELLKEEIRALPHLFGAGVEAVVAGMDPGAIALYPNVRLDHREIIINERFGEELARVGDVYVNEAFSASHRAHTSVVSLPRLLPNCAGRRTVMEVAALDNLHDPTRPYVAIVSGSKLTTKVGMLHSLLSVVDTLCVGGEVANVFIVAKGLWKTRRYATDEVEAARALLQEAPQKILIPEDVIIGNKDGTGAREVSVQEIPVDATGLWDIGRTSVRHIMDACAHAGSVLWNGPVGMFEIPEYARATKEIAEGLAVLNAYRVVGGGDTVNALERCSVVDRFNHVSVGGGAMIAYLERKFMPGLEPLYVKD